MSPTFLLGEAKLASDNASADRPIQSTSRQECFSVHCQIWDYTTDSRSRASVNQASSLCLCWSRSILTGLLISGRELRDCLNHCSSFISLHLWDPCFGRTDIKAADQLHPYMASIFLTGNGVFQPDNVACHKSSYCARVVSRT